MNKIDVHRSFAKHSFAIFAFTESGRDTVAMASSTHRAIEIVALRTCGVGSCTVNSFETSQNAAILKFRLIRSRGAHLHGQIWKTAKTGLNPLQSLLSTLKTALINQPRMLTDKPRIQHKSVALAANKSA